MATRISHQPAFCRFSFAFAFAALLPLNVVAIPAPGQAPPKPTTTTHTTSAARQAFEAASVRVVDPNSKVNHNVPNDPSAREPTFPANRWAMNYMGMISLICEAYSEIECGHVEGVPPWMHTNEMHYDIIAKVEGNAMLTKDQMRPMLRTLLEDRFHLKVHVEHRMVPGYALIVAQGGSKLKAHTNGPPSSGFFGGFQFKSQNVSADYLAQLIGWGVKQPVLNKTGLTGTYDVDLKFAPPEDSPLKDDPRFANLPNIFTAVQEQFGLKLRKEKVPGNYLVIDHVDKIPTEN